MLRSLPRAGLACTLGLLLASVAPAQEPAREATAAQVQAALAADDLERAHELLTELVVERRLDLVDAERAAGRGEAAWKILRGALALAPKDERGRALRDELSAELLTGELAAARTLLAADNPRDAMVRLDLALELAPHDPEVAFLRGECWLRIGLADGDVFAFADARAGFLEAARSERIPSAWSGAGRALFLSYAASLAPEELAQAVEFARRGAHETPDGDALAALLSTPVKRNHAEIAYFAYVTAKRAEEKGGTLKLRFEEARRALEACVGEAPEDTWGWLQLAQLFQWEERVDEERAIVARALALAPGNPELLARLGDAARRAGGFQESIGAYQELVDAEPSLAIGHWFLAGEQLELALDLINSGEHFVDADLAAAEASYVRCRELAEEHDAPCRWKEARCRLALGRAAFLRGELDAARDAYFSMEEAVEGGLQESYPGRIEQTGVDSLRVVVGAYMGIATDAKRSTSERLDAWRDATELATRVFDYRPEDPDIANDTGFVNRDAGEALAREAAALLQPYVDGVQPLPEDVRAEVGALLARANDAMEESYRAYAAASVLSPADARVANDTGLILAYYLQREIELARAHFERAIVLGTEQLAAGIDDQAQREDVTESVGDAHQGLGVIALTIHGDGAAAKPELETSIEIGPYERPEVERSYLPVCKGLLAGKLTPEQVKAAFAWGARDAEALLAKLRAQKAVDAALGARG